jgi:hypothetical protein
MDYKRIYEKIVQKAKIENRIKSQSLYYESHHILPKCLGGSNNKENLILLTPKEHFICHLLLMKIYENDKNSYLKMCRAFNMMATSNSKQNRYITSRTFQKFKEKMYGPEGILKGENAPFFGKTFSKETREKIRERQLSNNSMKGKKPWNFGKNKDNDERLKNYGKKISESTKGKRIVSDEHRQKLSESSKGKKKVPFSITHRQRIAEKRKNQIISDETKEKISAATKGKNKPKVQCPHCQKIGGNGSMGRWHFDNCKELK